MNLFLIGYRCTGKSSAGKLIAKTLGWSFIDADSELVRQCGQSISDIVDAQGWEGFREKEKAVIKQLCGFDRHVVATGGGIVLDKENVELMKKSGVIVLLKATPETVKSRIIQDHRSQDYRPALTSKGFVEEIEDTLLYRKPYYENAMDVAVDTDDIGIDEVCGIVVKKLKDMNVHK